MKVISERRCAANGRFPGDLLSNVLWLSSNLDYPTNAISDNTHRLGPPLQQAGFSSSGRDRRSRRRKSRERERVRELFGDVLSRAFSHMGCDPRRKSVKLQRAPSRMPFHPTSQIHLCQRWRVKSARIVSDSKPTVRGARRKNEVRGECTDTRQNLPPSVSDSIYKKCFVPSPPHLTSPHLT